MSGREDLPTFSDDSWRADGLEAEEERIKVLKQMISDVSHDLRTPLAIINSAAYMLNLKVRTPEEQALVERIRLQVKRLDQIIEDMFTMTALDTMRPEDTYSLINVNDMASAICNDVLQLAQEKSITLSYQPGENIPFIMGNKNNLWRAFTNVVINAVHFTPEGGRVVIRTSQRNGYVLFEVLDSGIGITPEDLPHIFERFYRADKARRTVTGGSGLGLAIVKRIIDYHQGEIKVQSVPGKGSAFCLMLPTLDRLIPR